MNHLRRNAFLYILAILFLGSWAGQAATQAALGDTPTDFLAATFENWQSEFLQLLIQALGMYVIARWVFTRATEDLDRIEKKTDALLLMMQGVNSIITNTPDDEVHITVTDLPDDEVQEQEEL